MLGLHANSSLVERYIMTMILCETIVVLYSFLYIYSSKEVEEPNKTIVIFSHITFGMVCNQAKKNVVDLIRRSN